MEASKNKLTIIINNGKKMDIILIGERPSDARDNGYWLFKYTRENHPKINIYYIIKEDSPDLDKIEHLGNIVIYDSDQHKRLFHLANILVCTHTRGTIEPSSFNKYKVSKQYPDYYHKKYFFIQHGVNVSNFISAFKKDNTINAAFSKIVCGALPEYNYLRNNLGYEDGVVTYSGLARHDSLLAQKDLWGTENTILFMPTWRGDICSPSYKQEKIYNDYRFLSSDYFSKILELLNNKKLSAVLRKNDLKLHFIPHPEVTKYLKYITTTDINIKILNPKSVNIQDELIKAKLLITDYSSVFFDFSYMKKPTIFYQHDREVFFSKHYKKGYFDFSKHYFGETVNDISALTSEIRKTIYNKFNFSTDAELNHRLFFPKYDTSNCERNFQEMLSLMQ